MSKSPFPRLSPAASRQRIIERLQNEGAYDLARPLEDCGQGFGLVCQACGVSHETITRCKKRWCPECARIVSAKRLDKYSRAIAAMTSPIFVTLTMPHTAGTSSPLDVRTLRRALTKFRNQRWFRKRVTGGIASIEVTCGENGWHPHVHMLIECRWLSVKSRSPQWRESKKKRAQLMADSQAEVVAKWQKALGLTVGGGVYLTRARENCAVEVLKYAVKPGDLVNAKWPLAPLLRVLAVSRLISTWGSVRRSYASQSLEATKTPLVCPCGASSWIPEVVLASIVSKVAEAPRGHHAVTMARKCDAERSTRAQSSAQERLAKMVCEPWESDYGDLTKVAASASG